MKPIIDKREISDAIQGAFRDMVVGIQTHAGPKQEMKVDYSGNRFADSIESVTSYNSPGGNGNQVLLKFKNGRGLIIDCAREDPPGWDTDRFIKEGYVPWKKSA